MNDILVYLILNGSIYVLISLGLMLSYGLQGNLDVANPAFMLVGSYLALQLARWGYDPLITLPIVIVVLFAVGVLVHRGVVGPLRGRPHMDVALALFGVLFIIENGLNMVWSADFQRIKVAYIGASVPFFGQTIELIRLLGPVAAVLAIAAVSAVLMLTPAGRIVRGTYSNREAAELSGIATLRVDDLVYGLSVAVTGLGGFITGSSYVFSAASILPWFFIAFAVVVMGGRGSILGSVAAALLLALAEAVTAHWLSFVWIPLVSAAALIITLIVRPSGIGGGLSGNR